MGAFNMPLASNPVLDEIKSLSPSAKSALMQAHGSATPPQQTQAPNPTPQMQPPSQSAPMMGAPKNELGASMPSSYAQPIGPQGPAMRGTVEGEQERRNSILSQKPALENVYGKVTGSEFGQNHPLAGKILGALGQIPATAADIALTHGVPRIGSLIPGTTIQHGLQAENANKMVNQTQGEAEKQAAIGEKQATIGNLSGEQPLHQAQTREANARADALENPPEKQGEWAVDPNFTGPNGEPVLFNKDTSEFKVGDQVLGIKRAEKPATPKSMEHVNLQDAQGKPFEGNYHPDTGAYTDAAGNPISNPRPYEKPMNVNVGQNEADKMGARLGKPYETAGTQAQAKLDRIDQTSRSVDAGYVGQGLAIPELLTSLVSGQGTGVRITQPELNAITRHRGIQGDAESWFNSLAGKGNLTAQDKAQIKDVLKEAKSRVLTKIAMVNDAQDAINAANDRATVVQADQKYRHIISNAEKYLEVRRDDAGNYYGSNDGGKTAFDLATGKEAK